MRARLIVEAGAALPEVCDLHPAQTARIRLGRNRNNTIVLKDQHASRWHAEIFPSEGRWFIEDRGTTNGTRINGERIRRATPLVHGQEIAIGDTRLRFTVDPSNEKTDEMPSLGAAPAPRPDQDESGSELSQTTLQADELTALFHFVDASHHETTPWGLVNRALETARRQTQADVCGFLSLDPEDPEFKLVLPAQAEVDVQLSVQLTQRVLREGCSVWLGAPESRDLSSDSLLHFRDAVCVPLRARPPAGDAPGTEPPLGALHVYTSNRLFGEREVRFCEVLAGYLANSLHGLRARRALEADNSRLRVHSPASGDELVGDSPALCAVREKILRLANGSGTVLIIGESGVGKELVALGLHRASPRRDGPLVPVNCAAITASMPESELFGHARGSFTGAAADRPGYFRQADDGTLFLDEIGELSLECQAMLLRALETKKFQPVGATALVKVDVRIIAATNRDLEREVAEGKFRRDLFYRLGATIKVPPLREHPEDIPALVAHFLDRLSVEYRRRLSLSEAALERLQTFSWPGNVRQLRSVLETAVTMTRGDIIHVGDLSLKEEEPVATGEPPASLNLVELEMWAIRQALNQTGGNTTQAARLLGIHRETLTLKMRKYGIERRP